MKNAPNAITLKSAGLAALKTWVQPEKKEKKRKFCEFMILVCIIAQSIQFYVSQLILNYTQ